MDQRVLFVDDDVNILAAYKRQLRKDFDLEIAEGGSSGLEIIAQRGPFAVVVSDYKMPNMDGIQFLAQVKKIDPDISRIMITGFADLNMAMEAVNEGNIFRFLTKPCSAEGLLNAINTGLAQYSLIKSEKELLEKTLNGSLKILVDILSIVNPTAFGRSSRVRKIMKQFAEKLNNKMAWKYELSGILSQIGCVAIPDHILEKKYKGEGLTETENTMFNEHPKLGYELVSKIPRLEDVAEVIRNQGLKDAVHKNSDIDLCIKCLNVTLDFDTLVSTGENIDTILEKLAQKYSGYHKSIFSALNEIVNGVLYLEQKSITVKDLQPGMVFSENVLSSTGLMLISKGQEVTLSVVARLKNFANTLGVREPIRVFLSNEEMKNASEQAIEKENK